MRDVKNNLLQPIEDVRYREDQIQNISADLIDVIRQHGWDCQTWEDPPGTVHPPHDHPYSHRVLCVNGKIEFVVEGQAYDLRPGDVLDLPRKVTHSAETGEDGSTEYWLLKPA